MGKGYGEMSVNYVDPVKQEIDAKANKRALLSLVLGIVTGAIGIYISALMIYEYSIVLLVPFITR